MTYLCYKLIYSENVKYLCELQKIRRKMKGEQKYKCVNSIIFHGIYFQILISQQIDAKILLKVIEIAIKTFTIDCKLANRRNILYTFQENRPMSKSQKMKSH